MEGGSRSGAVIPYRRASLLGIPAEIFKIIYQKLDDESRKSLRLVHSFLLARCRGIEKTLLRLWSFRILTADQLLPLADEVVTIEGLMIGELVGDQSSVEVGLQHLFAKHPELRRLELMKSQCGYSTLQLIFSRLEIVVLRLRHCNFAAGDSDGGIPRPPPPPRATSVLQTLDLSFCSGIADKMLLHILDSIGTGSLKTLDLSHTDVTAAAVSTKLPRLEELDLGRCRNLDAKGLKFILSETRATLKKLNLKNALIRNSSDPPPFHHQVEDSVLEELNLGGCVRISPLFNLVDLVKMAGKSLKKLVFSHSILHEQGWVDALAEVGLPVLEELDLTNCHLQDSQLIALLNMTGGRLRKLNITGNGDLTLADTTALRASFPNLEAIQAVYCVKLTDEGLLNLVRKAGASRLRDLDVSFCLRLKESNMVLLLCMVAQSLRRLNLTGTALTWHDYHTYVSLPALESIDVTLCEALTNEALLHMLAISRGSLRKLNLSGTGVSLPSAVASPKPGLEELILVGCKELDETNVVLFISEFSATLKLLRLGHSNITLAEVGALADSFPQLEHLDFIGGCANILVASVITILNKTGATLRRLSLCDLRFTQADVEALSSGFPVLKELNLIGNTDITDQLLVSLLNKLGGGGLSKLFLRGTSGLDKSMILAKFPKLKIID